MQVVVVHPLDMMKNEDDHAVIILLVVVAKELILVVNSTFVVEKQVIQVHRMIEYYMQYDRIDGRQVDMYKENRVL
jgi:hypothetical protein